MDVDPADRHRFGPDGPGRRSPGDRPGFVHRRPLHDGQQLARRQVAGQDQRVGEAGGCFGVRSVRYVLLALNIISSECADEVLDRFAVPSQNDLTFHEGFWTLDHGFIRNYGLSNEVLLLSRDKLHFILMFRC